MLWSIRFTNESQRSLKQPLSLLIDSSYRSWCLSDDGLINSQCLRPQRQPKVWAYRDKFGDVVEICVTVDVVLYVFLQRVGSGVRRHQFRAHLQFEVGERQLRCRKRLLQNKEKLEKKVCLMRQSGSMADNNKLSPWQTAKQQVETSVWAGRPTVVILGGDKRQISSAEKCFWLF